MIHYVASWLGTFGPKGRTACGIVVFKSNSDGEADTETCDRIDYVEIWPKVTCRKCLRSTEHKRLALRRNEQRTKD